MTVPQGLPGGRARRASPNENLRSYILLLIVYKLLPEPSPGVSTALRREGSPQPLRGPRAQGLAPVWFLQYLFVFLKGLLPAALQIPELAPEEGGPGPGPGRADPLVPAQALEDLARLR